MTVSAEAESVIGQSTTQSTTYPARLIDRLPAVVAAEAPAAS